MLPRTNHLYLEYKNYKVDSTDDKKKDQKIPVEKKSSRKGPFWTSGIRLYKEWPKAFFCFLLRRTFVAHFFLSSGGWGKLMHHTSTNFHACCANLIQLYSHFVFALQRCFFFSHFFLSSSVEWGKIFSYTCQFNSVVFALQRFFLFFFIFLFIFLSSVGWREIILELTKLPYNFVHVVC